MSDGLLTARMKDYFTRQLAWFEGLLADLAAIQPGMDDLVLTRLIDQMAHHAKGTETLEQEFWALLPEWEAATDML